jgi:hypothetical protein
VQGGKGHDAEDFDELGYRRGLLDDGRGDPGSSGADDAGGPSFHEWPTEQWRRRFGHMVGAGKCDAERTRYQRLVDDNAAFRRARMIKECTPVTDPQLHEQCVASFNQGSSTAPSE